MTESAPGPRVTRLARLRKGPLGTLYAILFSLAAALPLSYAVLLIWSLGRADGLADPAGWTILIGAYLSAALGGLILHFVLYPDVELYSHGIVIRWPGRRTILPWEAVTQARETRGPTLLGLDAHLTPLHRALGLILARRGTGRAVILLPRRHRRYPQARAVLRDVLAEEGRFIAL